MLRIYCTASWSEAEAVPSAANFGKFFQEALGKSLFAPRFGGPMASRQGCAMVRGKVLRIGWKVTDVRINLCRVNVLQIEGGCVLKTGGAYDWLLLRNIGLARGNKAFLIFSMMGALFLLLPLLKRGKLALLSSWYIGSIWPFFLAPLVYFGSKVD